MNDRVILTVAVLGGTGNEGQGLATRWARAGYRVLIGSRTPEKAQRVAAELNEKLGSEMVHGEGNEDAAAECDIAVLTIPFSAQEKTLTALKESLEGKLLVNATVPLDPDDLGVVRVPEAGSAAQAAKALLGEGVSVCCAFQNVSHTYLRNEGPVPCDVLVCGDSPAAREQTVQLVQAAGMVGWDAGPLENAVVVEGLTALLVGINRHHSIKHAGLRITGVQKP